jgi:integrase
MKLASHLWKSRHGIYYIRFSHGGVDVKRSLKTRDPLLAKRFAYTLGHNMTIPNDLLARLLSGQTNIKTYSIKSGDIEIETDGTQEDHANVMQALNLVIQLKNTSPSTSVSPTKNITQLWKLRKCIEDYRNERDKTVRPRTRQGWDTDFRQLIAGFGPESIVSEINPDQYASWRTKTIDLLVPSSQDTKNNVYKIFFDWCIERKRCTDNPVVSLKIHKNMRAELQKKGGRHRQPYSAEDLSKLFDPELRAKIKKPCLFWLPLIAFYTGARLEELGALEITDIKEYGAGKWQFTLKKGKNESSIRTIPIHPEIINAGIIDYMKDVKKIWPNAITLFPYMKPVKDRLTHRFSQDYGKFKNDLGIVEGKDFHSYRATLIGCLKRNKANEDIKRAYVGHENEGKKDEHDLSYGDKTPYLVGEIATEIFPKIDFLNSHQFTMSTQLNRRGQFNKYLISSFKNSQNKANRNKINSK